MLVLQKLGGSSDEQTRPLHPQPGREGTAQGAGAALQSPRCRAEAAAQGWGEGASFRERKLGRCS